MRSLLELDKVGAIIPLCNSTISAWPGTPYSVVLNRSKQVSFDPADWSVKHEGIYTRVGKKDWISGKLRVSMGGQRFWAVGFKRSLGAAQTLLVGSDAPISGTDGAPGYRIVALISRA